MKLKIAIVLLLVLVILGYCIFCHHNRTPAVYSTGQDVKQPWSIETVSIVGLLADPQRFAGKHVKTEGWVRFGEKPVLYLHAEDAKQKLTLNAIGLVLNGNNQAQEQIAASFDRTYCVVEGDFRPRGDLNVDLFSGYITNISYLARLNR